MKVSAFKKSSQKIYGKKRNYVLAGWLSWLEHHPVQVVGSILVRESGMKGGNQLMFLSLSSSLSKINKHILRWGYISERTQNTNLKEHKHPYVHCSIIYSHQDMEAVHMSITRWVDKTTMGHLHNGILWSHKKEENITLCDSMDGPREHYAKWNKPVRERKVPYDFTHLWNQMKTLN